MAEVSFAKAFRRHVDCPVATVPGGTVAEALGAYFDRYPPVRSYVLDESGAVRRHVAVFVNRDVITDRVTLSDAITADDTIHVFQALSGG